MEAQGDRDGIPIVVPETGALLELLARVRGARRIVEVGTAIGVSTLYMARALPPDGTIVSFEVDERRHQAARAYLERAGCSAAPTCGCRTRGRASRSWKGSSTWRSSTASRPSTWTTWSC